MASNVSPVPWLRVFAVTSLVRGRGGFGAVFSIENHRWLDVTIARLEVRLFGARPGGEVFADPGRVMAYASGESAAMRGMSERTIQRDREQGRLRHDAATRF